MAFGAVEALSLVDALVEEGELGDYHLLAAARGDLLERVGKFDEARVEFKRAERAAPNVRDKRVMRERARKLAGSRSGGLS